MSNKINHRRSGQKRDSKMPRWRRTQTICNGSQGVAKGRRRWKRIRERKHRRQEMAAVKFGRGVVFV